MIDIHCHLLYKVDDGSGSPEESVAMLREAAAQGITAIIMTPHYRHGMFPFDLERVVAHYERIKPVAKELGIELYLGTEYHVNSRIIDYLRAGRCLTLAGTHYVLTEYAYGTEYSYIQNMTRDLILQGFLPVIAHAERYECIQKKPERAAELQSAGALIQINCDAVLGMGGHAEKRCCKKLLREAYVDIIASDSHGIEQRVCHMRKCYEHITKKYGGQIAQLLMERNPARILEGERIKYQMM